MTYSPPAIPPAPPLPPRRNRLLVWLLALGGLFVLALAIVAGVVIWQNRPIREVTLSAAENAVLERKIEILSEPERATQAPEDVYQAGARELAFTEREVNGLLNQNLGNLGDVSLNFATDEIHARIQGIIPTEVPMIGGNRFTTTARIITSQRDGRPVLIVEDVSSFGVSIPADWLGGLKGRDLLPDIFPNASKPGIPGIEAIRVTPGKFALTLSE